LHEPSSAAQNVRAGIFSPEAQVTAETAAAMARQASGWSIGWGIALVIFGALAIGSPFVAAVAVSVFISWIIIFGGIVHLVLALHSHRAGSLIWKLLVGLCYVVIGMYLLWHPVLSVAALTLLVAGLLLVEGVLNIIMFFHLRSLQGSAWILFDGAVTLILAMLIYLQWPSSSVWAIGTLVGVSMIISGITRVMLSLAVRGMVGKAA
jgi:uncharacterized membrane protein HdeD (DUF308 family)